MRPMFIAFAAPFAAAALALGGCASAPSEPVAGFDGSWTIAKRGVIAARPEPLTRAALAQAAAHCAVAGKRFRQIEVKESPAGLLAPQAESTLTFACD